MRVIWRLNRKYDGLKEPKRFLVAMALILWLPLIGRLIGGLLLADGAGYAISLGVVCALILMRWSWFRFGAAALRRYEESEASALPGARALPRD